MGYQALLFCPDEKTARTVTQVLNELDFTVNSCTEPFAAVKKLMAERFDAVVVDCDNEQNATLLFKSARNTVNNQSSLAVAVVEGQAGVAKAFRIGANLVLTKPINVEQAKGTLRVARGLLRKSDAAKPATAAASTAVNPAASLPALLTPAPRRAVPSPPTTRPAAPIAPMAPPPRIAASIPTHTAETGSEPSSAASQTIASPSIPELKIDKIEIAASQPEAVAPTLGAGLSLVRSANLGSNTASAPAPAREAKPNVSIDDNTSAVLAEPEGPAPALTFGGTDYGDAKPAGGGSKKVLLAVAMVVLIAAGAYEAWMQWGRFISINVPARVVAQPATAPNAVSAGTPSAPSSAIPSTSDSTTAAQPTETGKDSSQTQTAQTAEKTQGHPGRGIVAADSAKASASGANKAKAQADEEPIVIKNDFAQPTAKPVAQPDVPPPSTAAIAAAVGGQKLPNLVDGQTKAPTPVLQTLHVSQGVSRGLLVKKAQPVYPPSALDMRIEGAVELLATISKTGDISAVKVLSGDPNLAHAAADAVKQWKYKPYLLNGEPVEIQTQITVNFKLPN
ncbi:MAG: TonB family protein [Candidatus Sulfotelmatobacter sp.]